MFFFAPLIAPVYSLLIIYVLAAVVPAVLLMQYVYKQNCIEREALGLSQILCKHFRAVQNRAKFFQGGGGISCCRLVYNIITPPTVTNTEKSA